MLSIGQKQTVILYNEPVDMRNRINGLMGIVRNRLNCDPENGFIYAFISARKNVLALLRCEPDGIALYTKRLDKGGVFERPLHRDHSNITMINTQELLFIISGVIGKNHFRKRYQYPVK